MDWVPIVILCLAVSVYFTFKDGNNLPQQLGLLILVLILVFGSHVIDWPGNTDTSASYIATVLGLLLPLVLYLFKTKFVYGKYVLFSLLAFSLAITFRVMDSRLDLLYMGTHWLWHSFGATAVFFLMKYIYLDRLHLQSPKYSAVNTVK
jgi:hemolysin III